MTWLADDELAAHLRDLESQWVERKQSAAERSGIHRNICAFASDLSGSDRVGVIFMGLKDDGHCAGLSAIRLYLQGIRACGPDAERARWAAP